MSTDDREKDDPNAWTTYRCRPCNVSVTGLAVEEMTQSYFNKPPCPFCGGLMHLESYAGGAVE